MAATAVLKPVRIRKSEAVTDLAGALASLGISVYPIDQVEAYQRQFRNRLLLPYIVDVALAAMLTAIFLLATIPFNGAKVIALAICCLLFTRVTIGALRGLERARERFRWINQVVYGDMKKYGIPPRLIKKARRIRNILPGVQFSVERMDVDPFIYAHHRKLVYCFGHWGEPRFDQ